MLVTHQTGLSQPIMLKLRSEQLLAAVNNLPKRTCSVLITMLNSNDWQAIGKKLMSLSELTSLRVEESNANDSLCGAVCASKSLTEVVMSKHSLTKAAATSPMKEYGS